MLNINQYSICVLDTLLLGYTFHRNIYFQSLNANHCFEIKKQTVFLYNEGLINSIKNQNHFKTLKVWLL